MTLNIQIDDLAVLITSFAPLPVGQGVPVQLDELDLIGLCDLQGGAVAVGLAAGLAFVSGPFLACAILTLRGWNTTVSAVHTSLGHQQLDVDLPHCHAQLIDEFKVGELSHEAHAGAKFSSGKECW
ncbi:hypothetical protein [uncultured Microbulbifer sp.]|uniref:hypothetical protein n=1 Tax=uncultured Microbulbifer sp. TaxID=348147 RepID=UPI002604E0CC|nr:hypothetical protein [uncultured Microbulbifer sp.]